MADVAMAIWGKDAGDRALVAHLVFVCNYLFVVWEPKTLKKSFPPRNVILLCRFVPFVSNIFVWFMNTGCVTMHHQKYY